jgi:hypothetical protein
LVEYYTTIQVFIIAIGFLLLDLMQEFLGKVISVFGGSIGSLLKGGGGKGEVTGGNRQNVGRHKINKKENDKAPPFLYHPCGIRRICEFIVTA